MATETTLNNVFWGHSDGVLVLSASGLLWRSRSTEAQKKLLKDDIVTMLYTPMGDKQHHLKVYQRGGKYVRFTGLKRADIDALRRHVETQLDRELEQEKVAARGGNWGTMRFEGPNLNFRDDDASVLEIPLELVSQCALPGKNEVELQFHEDDTVAGDEETLVEMRLYLPPPSATAGDDADGDGGADGAGDGESMTAGGRANIRHATGKAIVELDESLGTFLTPRGRYGIEIYATFLRMHGKTFDYKIMYSNINRCFLLELPNGNHTAFVISLEEPIRQGKQGYPHLVLQLAKDDVHIDIKKYNGNIHEHMSGALPQIVATLFKFIIGKKVYTSGKFKTHSGERAVKCAVKAQSGVLFPPREPTTFIRYEEIEFVEFQRYAGQSGSSASRNFDLLVSCNSPELSQFLANKKLRIRNLKDSAAPAAGAGGGASGAGKKRGFNEYLEAEEGEIEDEDDDEEEEDSDFAGEDSDGSEGDYSDESLSGSGGSEGEDDEEEDGKKAKKKRKDDTPKKKKSKSKRDDADE
ncbi:hypothetical protein PINS_up016001 [Pythium insidiosum]|nr:hypothetical protein PINS_up016001 [Pythium insidiosum]